MGDDETEGLRKRGYAMEFAECILKVKQGDYNRSLFNTGCVDYMRHMSGMFKSSCNFRSKTFLDVMFCVIVLNCTNILLRRQDVKTFSGTNCNVIGLKLEGLSVSSFFMNQYRTRFFPF